MGGLGRLVDYGVVILECNLVVQITGLKRVPAPAPHFGLIFYLSVGILRHG